MTTDEIKLWTPEEARKLADEYVLIRPVPAWAHRVAEAVRSLAGQVENLTSGTWTVTASCICGRHVKAKAPAFYEENEMALQKELAEARAEIEAKETESRALTVELAQTNFDHDELLAERDALQAKCRAAVEVAVEAYLLQEDGEGSPSYTEEQAKQWVAAKLANAADEGKKCSCGESSPDRLVVHRTDGPCYLRERRTDEHRKAEK